MANDSCCNGDAEAFLTIQTTGGESPLACNLDAFTAAERPRYGELRKMIASAVIGKRELADGVALKVATDRITLAHLAEWISFERKCCPFFDFRIDVAREAGPVWLSLTGRAGVKAFLSEVFSS
jgi:hypothetical protein